MLNQEIYNNCLKVLEKRMPIWVDLSDMLQGFDENICLTYEQKERFVKTNRFIFNLSKNDFNKLIEKFSDKKRYDLELSEEDKLKECTTVAILLLTEEIKNADNFLDNSLMVSDSYLNNLFNYRRLIRELGALSLTDDDLHDYILKIFLD